MLLAVVFYYTWGFTVVLPVLNRSVLQLQISHCGLVAGYTDTVELLGSQTLIH